MNDRPARTGAVTSILHPSDFSRASHVAFAHALKIALVAGARLSMFHVASSNAEIDWDGFPGVRDTLERWKLIPPGSPRSAVPELGIDVRKVVTVNTDPVEAVLEFLEEQPTDLVVLAHEQRTGWSAWTRRSVAEPVARRSGEMTLFVPDGQGGFVSLADGTVHLDRVLIPVAADPPAVAAIRAAANLVTSLQAPQGAFTTLHVGPDAAPILSFPEVSGWTWDALTRTGDVVEQIVAVARETQARLIVMTTNGRDGFLDALRGTHSERVLNQCPCPLLVVPEAHGANV
jgi:nucleotide-binding universal stress UspA family protein